MKLYKEKDPNAYQKVSPFFERKFFKKIIPIILK